MQHVQWSNVPSVRTRPVEAYAHIQQSKGSLSFAVRHPYPLIIRFVLLTFRPLLHGFNNQLITRLLVSSSHCRPCCPRNRLHSLSLPSHAFSAFFGILLARQSLFSNFFSYPDKYQDPQYSALEKFGCDIYTLMHLDVHRSSIRHPTPHPN